MQRRAAGLGMVLLIAATGCAVRVRRPAASGQPPPATAAEAGDAPRIDVDAAFAELRAGRAVLVDVRSRASYGSRHAAGALALPLDEIEQAPPAALAALPAARRPILYCT